MKERRILFNAHDVRAILSAHKTQVRSVIKPQPDQVFKDMAILYTPQDEGLGRLGKVLICPYGAESWATNPWVWAITFRRLN